MFCVCCDKNTPKHNGWKNIINLDRVVFVKIDTIAASFRRVVVTIFDRYESPTIETADSNICYGTPAFVSSLFFFVHL